VFWREKRKGKDRKREGARQEKKCRERQISTKLELGREEERKRIREKREGERERGKRIRIRGRERERERGSCTHYSTFWADTKLLLALSRPTPNPGAHTPPFFIVRRERGSESKHFLCLIRLYKSVSDSRV